MITLKVYKRLMFVVAFLCIGISATYISLSAVGILDAYKNIAIFFAILTPTFYVLLAFTFFLYSNERANHKHLIAENKYNFGIETEIYNSFYFQRRVNYLRRLRRYRDKQAYLISFTATKAVVMRNYNRNDIVTAYLTSIVEYLFDTLSVKKDSDKSPFAYCYYHGVFVIYAYGNDSSIEQLIDKIENNLYQIANDNQYNLYVQPSFGINKLTNASKETLIPEIAKALVTRDNAERRFERISYYGDLTIRETTMSEVDEIKLGLQNEEFVIYYQPKFSLSEQKFISTEALVRWNSKTYGLLPPSKFIETAEQSGLIHAIDDYVFEHVCRDINDNRIRGRRNLPVSVNFSVQEFYDTNFIDSIVKNCQKYKVSPSMIQIEVTESTSQANSFMSSTIINKLRDYGFRVLMDDFGTGFSNIENLMLIPFDAVKLDRSYIERIVSDSKSRELVKFLIRICKMNKMEVIAEGVDSQEQVNILRNARCDTIQGYFYSKPIPSEELNQFLLNNPFERKSKEDKQ